MSEQPNTAPKPSTSRPTTSRPSTPATATPSTPTPATPPPGLVNAHFPTPLGWSGGARQTIRSRIVRKPRDIEAVGTTQSVLVQMTDGSTDRLAVTIHRPRVRTVDQPVLGGLVLLVHGLGGSIESDYIRATTVGLLGAGFNVARLDMRGAGASAATSSGLYHAGKTQDIRDVLKVLAKTPEARSPLTGTPQLAVMGFSLGANITIKLAGEPLDNIPLVAAVAVSAPLDLSYGAQYLAQAGGGLYERFLVAGLKRQMLQPNADGSSRLTPDEQDLLPSLRTIVDFDDAITAPRHGWRDASQYYTVNSSGQFLPLIRTPTLVIHSIDDPMIPAKPYGEVDWQSLAATGFVSPMITERGGHVGFHQRGAPLPWFVNRAVDFLLPIFEGR